MTETTTGRKSRTATLNTNLSFPAYVPPPAGSEGGNDNEYNLTTLPESETVAEQETTAQAETNSSGYANGPENHQNGVAPANHDGIINTTPGEVEQEKPVKSAKPSKGTKVPKGGAGKPRTSKKKSDKNKEKETEMPVAVKTPPAKAKGQAPQQQPKKTSSNGAAGNTATIRQRVFELLGKNPEGLTGRAIAEKLSLKGIPNLLKDEGVCEKPRIKRVVIEGVRGTTYVLTAAGKNDLAKGKVDENAAPSSSGVEW